MLLMTAASWLTAKEHFLPKEGVAVQHLC